MILRDARKLKVWFVLSCLIGLLRFQIYLKLQTESSLDRCGRRTAHLVNCEDQLGSGRIILQHTRLWKHVCNFIFFVILLENTIKIRGFCDKNSWDRLAPDLPWIRRCWYIRLIFGLFLSFGIPFWHSNHKTTILGHNMPRLGLNRQSWIMACHNPSEEGELFVL